MRIVTQYKTNVNGVGQVIAKGNGKQRTVTYRPENSRDRNHGEAAGTLALVLIQGEAARRAYARAVGHRVQADQRHVFDLFL